ncbi:hypothetical protein E1263_14405 [Kribbella antibiotica]|uniref:Lipoprotein n=1 Tax=Kribbella antibiotica TaxID=190195 RepID=A0A4R4ZL71_9ACTN|nr:hypothetical protein [Kribbella antibiotica]TDD59538.1 hypothetical protein E1263_14405 [Kribbella antibiotica]
MRLIAGLVVAGVILSGCSTADSQDIHTSGIKADLRVTVTDYLPGAEAEALLRVGTLTYVKLGKNESISASGAGSTQELMRNKSLGVTNYSTPLNGTFKGGDEITFALKRNPETSAPSSTVVLPERLQLTAPATGTTASRTSPITVQFYSVAPTALPTTVSWSGSCIQESSLQFPPGATGGKIPADLITLATAPSPDQSNTKCTIRIRVFRQTKGSLDPAFKEGSITAEAQSFREITSIS